MNKEINVAFDSEELKREFERLKTSKYEDKLLFKSIDKAIIVLKQNPESGIKIPRKLWPKAYSVTNLWKYDLPNAWRLIYTIQTDEVRIVSIILEWFDHKEYERRFGY